MVPFFQDSVCFNFGLKCSLSLIGRGACDYYFHREVLKMSLRYYSALLDVPGGYLSCSRIAPHLSRTAFGGGTLLNKGEGYQFYCIDVFSWSNLNVLHTQIS